eukprot:Clim_evm13s206 gene=Clim_evmTU13s206
MGQVASCLGGHSATVPKSTESIDGFTDSPERRAYGANVDNRDRIVVSSPGKSLSKLPYGAREGSTSCELDDPRVRSVSPLKAPYGSMPMLSVKVEAESPQVFTANAVNPTVASAAKAVCADVETSNKAEPKDMQRLSEDMALQSEQILDGSLSMERKMKMTDQSIIFTQIGDDALARKLWAYSQTADFNMEGENDSEGDYPSTGAPAAVDGADEKKSQNQGEPEGKEEKTNLQKSSEHNSIFDLTHDGSPPGKKGPRRRGKKAMKLDRNKSLRPLKLKDGNRYEKVAETMQILKTMITSEDKETHGMRYLQSTIIPPEDSDENDWMAVNIVEFYNEVNLVYGTIMEFCTEESCPQMTAGKNFQYLWFSGKPLPADFKDNKYPPARTYINCLVDEIDRRISDDRVFPTTSGGRYPEKFRKVIKKICKCVLRIYAHMYYHHIDDILKLGVQAQVNQAYERFYLFMKYFDLVNDEELAPVKEFTELMIEESDLKDIQESEREQERIERERAAAKPPVRAPPNEKPLYFSDMVAYSIRCDNLEK